MKASYPPGHEALPRRDRWLSATRQSGTQPWAGPPVATATVFPDREPTLAAGCRGGRSADPEHDRVRTLARRLGFDPDAYAGAVSPSIEEANRTALLAALTHHFPSFASTGLWKLPEPPTFYVSEEARPSFVAAARGCGLGADHLRPVPIDAMQRIDVRSFEAVIRADRSRGSAPFMVVACVGTTAAGAVDPIPEVARAARREGIWLHVEVACGGAAALVPELRHLLDGIGSADSIALDGRGWTAEAAPLGLLLTRHPGALRPAHPVASDSTAGGTFEAEPQDPDRDPLFCPRRLLGLNSALALAAGEDVRAAILRRRVALGNLLREELRANGWEIVNRTALPVVCFHDTRRAPHPRPDRDVDRSAEAIAREVGPIGGVRLSATRISGWPVLRACFAGDRLSEADVRALVRELDEARRAYDRDPAVR